MIRHAASTKSSTVRPTCSSTENCYEKINKYKKGVEEKLGEKKVDRKREREEEVGNRGVHSEREQK
jgi:hypothetical protein